MKIRVILFTFSQQDGVIMREAPYKSSAMKPIMEIEFSTAYAIENPDRHPSKSTAVLYSLQEYSYVKNCSGPEGMPSLQGANTEHFAILPFSEFSVSIFSSYSI
jgi:hypothetical protein